jgi:hypothetical protein
LSLLDRFEVFLHAVEAGVDPIEPRINPIEPCINLIEPCINAIEPCINAIEPCVDLIEPRINVIEPCVDLIEPRIDVIEPAGNSGGEHVDFPFESLKSFVRHQPAHQSADDDSTIVPADVESQSWYRRDRQYFGEI